MPYAPKPAFHVVEPFEGVTIVQLNAAMKTLLQRFIEEVDEVEVEVVALGKALSDPAKAQELRRINQENRRHDSSRKRRIRQNEDQPI